MHSIYMYTYIYIHIYTTYIYTLIYYVYTTYIQRKYIYIYILIFTNPSAREGYDTRSIFKQSLSCLNSEFSFS